MKWKEKERKWKDVSDILHFSPIFSDILRFSPEMTEKTTGNDRENGSSGKRLRNEFLGNSTIFHSFSSILHGYSIKFRIFASV